jgi:hypothetical protein
VLHATTTTYGLLSAVWMGTLMIGGWLLTRRDRADAGISVAMLGALAVTCVAVLGMAVAPGVVWLVPLAAIGGTSNGVENVAAGVLLSRRTPAPVRGRAFAQFGAVASGTNALGFILGGVLLGLLSVRATVAVAGLFGLAVTATAAVPMLRAAARERDASAQVAPAEPAELQPAA